MISKTQYKIDYETINSAKETIDRFTDIKNILNQPTGNFFYDNWNIKREYEDSIWDQILSSLPFEIGEARIIKLDPGKCYLQHADIDDRFHLNISGENSYLVDVDLNQLYALENNGFWYEMDAGKIHSAINLGCEPRYQLVVRKLLTNKTLENYQKVAIYARCNKPRFQFDNQISPWLNRASKAQIIANFEAFDDHVRFYIDTDSLTELENFDNDKFLIKIDSI